MSSSASMLHALGGGVCPVFSGSLRRFQRCAGRLFLLRFHLLTAHHGHTVRAALRAAAPQLATALEIGDVTQLAMPLTF